MIKYLRGINIKSTMPKEQHNPGEDRSLVTSVTGRKASLPQSFGGCSSRHGNHTEIRTINNGKGEVLRKRVILQSLSQLKVVSATQFPK